MAKPSPEELPPDIRNEEFPEGLWIDDAHIPVMRMLRDLREARGMIADLLVLVRQMPGVRDSRTRGKLVERIHAEIFRAIMLEKGFDPTRVREVIEVYFDRVRPNRGPDAKRKAARRLTEPD
jgi:hypothetical protein